MPSARGPKRTRAILALALLLLAAFLARGLFVSRRPAKKADAGGGDRDISYLAFNEENRKSIEVKCRKSIARGGDEIGLEGISGVVFKSGRMNQDIHFFGDRGTAKDDFNHFQIEGNARIVGDEFTVRAAGFLMIHKKSLLSKEAAQFSGKTISGAAAEGIEFLFALNEYKFFAMAGTLTRCAQTYAVASRMLWMFKEQDRFELKGDSSIRTADSQLSGNEIIMRFANDFADLRSYVSLGNSQLHSLRRIPGAAAGEQEVLDISANTIESLFADDGSLERIMVFEQGRLKIEGRGSRSEIRSDNIDCWFHPQSQTVREVVARTASEVECRGAQDVSLAADQITFLYDAAGEMRSASAVGGARFSAADFRGSATKLQLDAEQNQLAIEGEGARIQSGGSTFHGSFFVIDTKKKRLSAPEGVQATLMPGKGSVLLRPAPLFLVAGNVTHSGDASSFKGQVQMFQDETRLQAAEVVIQGGKKLIVAKGRVRLQFLNEKEEIVLQGGTVTLDSGARRVVSQGEALLQQGGNALKAGTITLAFAADDRLRTIAAQDAVEFRNERLTGSSKRLDWEFAKDVLEFKNGAQIQRRNGGTTRGQQLRVNLKSNEIEVTGSGDRSETTLRQDQP